MAIILRSTKGSELTWAEVDGNFQSLYYSSSLVGNTIEFYFVSSSISHSIDLPSSVAGGVNIFDGTSLVKTGAGSISFTGSAITSVATSGSDGVLITVNSGGGGGSVDTGSLLTTASVSDAEVTFTKGDGSTFEIDVNNVTSSLTASYVAKAIETGSVSANTLTFTTFDGSTFDLTVDTGSGGGSTDTGSLLTTASAADNIITFTKGDGSTFDVTVDTGSGGGGGGTGIFAQSGSSEVYFTTYSLQITGSELEDSPLTGVNPTQSNAGTGGGVDKYAMSISQSVWHYSDNVGVPTSNAWQDGLDGSYFNRFDHNTDTAEILRFVAGLLSSSAPDATPNTRTWNSTTLDFTPGSTTSKSSLMVGVLGGSTTYRNARLSSEWTSSAAIDMSQTQSFRDVQDYLISKGWLGSNETGSGDVNNVGTHPFGTSNYGTNIPNTIYSSFSTLTFNADSVAGGSTVASSSIGAQAYGMGELQNPTTVTPYDLSIYVTQSFSDNSSDTTPDENSTFTTNSIVEYTISTEDLDGDSNGLFLGIIDTGNPQINNGYQDGKFLNSPGGYSGRKWSNSDSDGSTGNTTASIGYYRLHDINVGLKTGSQSDFSYQSPSSTTNGYYMPSLNTLGVTDITQNDPTVTINNNLVRDTFTITSRSLSGAPYVLDANITYSYDTDVSKSFDPCYGYSTTPIQSSNPTNQWTTIGSVTLNNSSVTVNTNGVQTSNANAGVFPAGSNPAGRRSTNDTPAIGDVAFLSSSLTFALTSNYSNVVQNKSTMETRNYNLSFRTTGRNWKNAAQTSTTANEAFYDATDYGQPSDSGSMAIYSRAQAYDPGSLTSFSETFMGENFRIKIDDDFLSGSYASGSHFTTGSYEDYSLDGLDLQVKPGYLAKPGGSYGYWLADPDASKTYKFYARAFQRNESTGATSMTVNVGKTLNSWESTSDGVSVALIFKSSGVENYSTPRIYDITQLTSNLIDGSVANDDHKNPFDTTLALYGNTGGSLASTTYTVPLRSADGMTLNGTNQDFIVIIRYKGDPTPVTNISITIS